MCTNMWPVAAHSVAPVGDSALTVLLMRTDVVISAVQTWRCWIQHATSWSEGGGLRGSSVPRRSDASQKKASTYVRMYNLSLRPSRSHWFMVLDSAAAVFQHKGVSYTSVINQTTPFAHSLHVSLKPLIYSSSLHENQCLSVLLCLPKTLVAWLEANPITVCLTYLSIRIAVEFSPRPAEISQREQTKDLLSHETEVIRSGCICRCGRKVRTFSFVTVHLIFIDKSLPRCCFALWKRLQVTEGSVKICFQHLWRQLIPTWVVTDKENCSLESYLFLFCLFFGYRCYLTLQLQVMFQDWEILFFTTVLLVRFV